MLFLQNIWCALLWIKSNDFLHSQSLIPASHFIRMKLRLLILGSYVFRIKYISHKDLQILESCHSIQPSNTILSTLLFLLLKEELKPGTKLQPQSLVSTEQGRLTATTPNFRLWSFRIYLGNCKYCTFSQFHAAGCTLPSAQLLWSQ